MNCSERRQPGVAQPSAAEIAGCFNFLFGRSHRVEMIGGGGEPEYLPATDESPGYVRYRSNFAHSALHEAAHWCIAGARRRQQVDYGYWYQSPPRDETTQLAFVQAESRVQALESILTSAAGMVFRVSLDDVENLFRFEADFADAVATATAQWWRCGLPPRAEKLHRDLKQLSQRICQNG
jgi:elongation factor P hydroxylase